MFSVYDRFLGPKPIGSQGASAFVVGLRKRRQCLHFMSLVKSQECKRSVSALVMLKTGYDSNDDKLLPMYTYVYTCIRRCV